jgi:hypothetical protein
MGWAFELTGFRGSGAGAPRAPATATRAGAHSSVVPGSAGLASIVLLLIAGCATTPGAADVARPPVPRQPDAPASEGLPMRGMSTLIATGSDIGQASLAFRFQIVRLPVLGLKRQPSDPRAARTERIARGYSPTCKITDRPPHTIPQRCSARSAPLPTAGRVEEGLLR